MPEAQAKETLPVPSLACNASFNPEPGHPLAGRDGDYPLSPSGAVPSPLREGRMRAGGLSWFCTRIFLLIAPPHECVALAQFVDGWYKSLIAKALRVANLPFCTAPRSLGWCNWTHDGRHTATVLCESLLVGLPSPSGRGAGSRAVWFRRFFSSRFESRHFALFSAVFGLTIPSGASQDRLRGWPAGSAQDRLRTGSGILASLIRGGSHG